MIRPGLARISGLLKNSQLPWKAIHVAGTNGKGSICAMVDALLRAGNVSTGRFTSPHVIDPWDCIQINAKPLAQLEFKQVQERIIREAPEDDHDRPSPFEFLTATAFEAFTQENVEVGIVETGMGGRADATNVLSSPLVTVISKIGMDHQNFLGGTLERIADHKAGIIKSGAPCVIDGTNSAEVLDVLKERARNIQSGTLYIEGSEDSVVSKEVWETIDKANMEPYQAMNTLCAIKAAELALKMLRPNLNINDLLPALKDAHLPGRLQQLHPNFLGARSNPILLDGAHNPQAAKALANYVDRKIRVGTTSVSWVIALSKGKDAAQMMQTLVRPQDKVYVTEFGPVEGMPWIQPMEAEVLASIIREACSGCDVSTPVNVREALVNASRYALEGPTVVAGSLYLASDVLRLHRDTS